MAMYAGMWIGAAVAPLAGTAIAGWGAIGTAIIAAWAVAATLCTARFTATRAATPLTVATSTAQGGP